MSVFLSRMVHYRVFFFRSLKIILNILLLMSIFIASWASPVLAKSPQSPKSDSLYQEPLSVLEKMTPQERIGQLFLVTFNGNDASTGTAIEQLITNYHIGGIILTTKNDNFSTDPDILQNTLNRTDYLH